MAMTLGKRFQRTISMSQIVPGSNLYAEKAPGIQADAAQKGAAGLTLVLNDQQQLLQSAVNQWEALRAASCSTQQEDHHHHQMVAAGAANQWEALKVGCSVQRDHHEQQQQSVAAADHQWEILKSAEAMMMMMLMGAGGQNSTQAESSVDELDQAMATQNGPYLQMGLWPHLLMEPVGSAPPAIHHSPSSPTVYFLDSCFFCKRRLRHERDIFIYKGDTAFCTEECRQHQILSDEARSQGASKKAGT